MTMLHGGDSQRPYDSLRLNRALHEQFVDVAVCDPTASRRVHDQWRAGVKGVGLHFEGVAYPASPVPFILDATEIQVLCSKLNALLQLLEELLDHSRLSPTVREFFPEYDEGLRGNFAYPGYRPRVRIARFDLSWWGVDRFQVMETNTSSPGGSIQNAVLGRYWRSYGPEICALQEMALAPDPWVDDPYRVLKAGLLQAAEQMGIEVQRAAAINIRGVYTNEVDWYVKGWREMGIPAAVHGAEELVYDDGCIMGPEGPSDVAFNKLDPLELITDPSLVGYRMAIHDQALCEANTLIVQLVTEDKRALALLTDPDWADLFDQQNLHAIRPHLPWTRRFMDCVTSDRSGERVPLLRYVETSRDHLVLKPANSTRGEGVVIGPDCSPSRWAVAVRSALDRSYVVQEYCALPTTTLPDLEGGPPNGPSHLGLDAYCFGGLVAGFQSRAARAKVVNVAKNGMVLPVVPVAGVC